MNGWILDKCSWKWQRRRHTGRRAEFLVDLLCSLQRNGIFSIEIENSCKNRISIKFCGSIQGLGDARPQKVEYILNIFLAKYFPTRPYPCLYSSLEVCGFYKKPKLIEEDLPIAKDMTSVMLVMDTATPAWARVSDIRFATVSLSSVVDQHAFIMNMSSMPIARQHYFIMNEWSISLYTYDQERNDWVDHIVRDS